MKKRLYSVKDVKSVFWSPQEDMNNETAIRNFSFLVNNNEMVGFCPQDYDLYYVGTFDSDTGKLEAADPIMFVVSGRAVFNDKERENAKC